MQAVRVTFFLVVGVDHPEQLNKPLRQSKKKMKEAHRSLTCLKGMLGNKGGVF